MPNYIKNRLRINGTPEQIQEVFKKYNTHIEATLRKAYDGTIICTSTDGVGWFNPNTGFFKTRNSENLIVGMPSNYRMEVSQPIDHFPDFDKIIPHPRTDPYYDRPTQQEAQISSDWWYNWNIKNWGTKWSASECQIECFGSYTFVTAWNGVVELMQELSKQNKGIEFEYSFADEDTSHNLGKYKILDGEITERFEPLGGTKEAYELAFELRPEIAEQYQFVNERYEYVEED